MRPVTGVPKTELPKYESCSEYVKQLAIDKPWVLFSAVSEQVKQKFGKAFVEKYEKKLGKTHQNWALKNRYGTKQANSSLPKPAQTKPTQTKQVAKTKVISKQKLSKTTSTKLTQKKTLNLKPKAQIQLKSKPRIQVQVESNSGESTPGIVDALRLFRTNNALQRGAQKAKEFIEEKPSVTVASSIATRDDRLKGRQERKQIMEEIKQTVQTAKVGPSGVQVEEWDDALPEARPVQTKKFAPFTVAVDCDDYETVFKKPSLLQEEQEKTTPTIAQSRFAQLLAECGAEEDFQKKRALKNICKAIDKLIMDHDLATIFDSLVAQKLANKQVISEHFLAIVAYTKQVIQNKSGIYKIHDKVVQLSVIEALEKIKKIGYEAQGFTDGLPKEIQQTVACHYNQAVAQMTSEISRSLQDISSSVQSLTHRLTLEKMKTEKVMQYLNSVPLHIKNEVERVKGEIIGTVFNYFSNHFNTPNPYPKLSDMIPQQGYDLDDDVEAEYQLKKQSIPPTAEVLKGLGLKPYNPQPQPQFKVPKQKLDRRLEFGTITQTSYIQNYDSVDYDLASVGLKKPAIGSSVPIEITSQDSQKPAYIDLETTTFKIKDIEMIEEIQVNQVPEVELNQINKSNEIQMAEQIEDQVEGQQELEAQVQENLQVQEEIVDEEVQVQVVQVEEAEDQNDIQVEEVKEGDVQVEAIVAENGFQDNAEDELAKNDQSEGTQSEDIDMLDKDAGMTPKYRGSVHQSEDDDEGQIGGTVDAVDEFDITPALLSQLNAESGNTQQTVAENNPPKQGLKEGWGFFKPENATKKPKKGKKK